MAGRRAKPLALAENPLAQEIVVEDTAGGPRGPGDRHFTKRTPERMEIVLRALKLGATLKVAASYAGITEVTIRNWRREDAEFDAKCLSAKAEMEVRLLATIEMAAKEPKNWSAAAWKLERIFPDRYGRSNRMELTGKGGGPIEMTDVRKLSDDELRRIASGEVTTYDMEEDE